ncbi:response regulator [uncultured Amnibacterium sp.]|uniref:response regulator n=1 Tax=uncultured Amnibacterium sp. TaxID=1631851 RepID=UPI0035CA2174
MTAPIRVAIADDQALVRAGFGAILSMSADIEVVGEATDGVEAMELVRRVRPDIVLMDVHMPRLDGIQATAAIVAAQLARVLVLTTFDLDEYVLDALRAGASGFLLKDTPAESLAPAIRTVHAGQSLLSPTVVARLVERHAPATGEDPRRRAALDRLTAREADALLALAEGLSNAEIAERMHVGEATVKTYVSAVLTKLALRDRLQAVVFAFETGIATPPTR